MSWPAIGRYTRWLHTQWPAGTVEKLPIVGPEGRCNVPGVWIVGDLTGIPLLKFSTDTGARAVQDLLREPALRARPADEGLLDLAIVGAGPSGIAAALEAQQAGLRFEVIEAYQPFNTIQSFPRRKPIFTYPTEMIPAGVLQFGEGTEVKEGLLEVLERYREGAGIEVTPSHAERVERRGAELIVHRRAPDGAAQITRARRVIVAIGRSGSYRKLGVPGEDLPKICHRLYDPRDFHGKDVLVVGGGDSALETAIALATCGSKVTLSYRKTELARAKPENIEQVQQAKDRGGLELLLGSQIKAIDDTTVELLDAEGAARTLPNQAVFAMIGREAPLDFFRRSGIRIAGEWSRAAWGGLAAFLIFCVWLYHWKSYGWSTDWGGGVLDPARWWRGLAAKASDRSTLLFTLLDSMSKPSFYYTLAYSILVGVFGVRRIRRRRTPYVTRQTLTLMGVQWLLLFLLPEIILPFMGRNELFVQGAPLRGLADLFFEPYDGGIGVERAYWRAYGFVLAWPLMVYNWFTDKPIWGWLALGGLQTFVLIPWMVRRWGKGAFCGWLCSCGALAETLGDTHRHKMPHGPGWNRLNMVGQAVLALAFVLLGVRVWGWIAPSSWAAESFASLLHGGALSYKWLVDVALAGVLGVGFYFHLSGRVWCRFACPLAALMHIYGRFSRFRIFADKKRCISCNLCTSVCHQGIDIMSFANKGLPMQDPQCVRCSACVQTCPTGVLSFGRLGAGEQPVYDRLPASPVQMRER